MNKLSLIFAYTKNGLVWSHDKELSLEVDAIDWNSQKKQKKKNKKTSNYMIMKWRKIKYKLHIVWVHHHCLVVNSNGDELNLKLCSN